MFDDWELTPGLCLVLTIVIMIFVLGWSATVCFILTSNKLVLIISYLISMILSVSCCALLHNKIHEFVAIGIIAFGFGCILGFNFSEEIDPGDVSAYVFGIILSATLMIPRYFIVTKFRDIYVQKKKGKIQSQILSKLENLTSENKDLEAQVEAAKKELRVLDLLERCGGNTSILLDNPRFGNIVKMQNRIEDNVKQISELEIQAKSIGSM